MSRRGLVLGAGGVLGAAWTVGALCAMDEVEGFDPRDADVIVGTSAGAVLAALLGSGVSAATLRDHQRGLPVPQAQTLVWDHETSAGGALPPRPRLRVGSRALLRNGARHPGQVPPMAMLWALVPAGRRELDPVRHLVDDLVPDGGWATRDGVWIVAMDYQTGDRVVFGRPGTPECSLSQAVVASCAIPGWYSPEVIGGRPYIDGGAWSATSVDLLAEAGLDEVYVLAPMASFAMDRPTTVGGRLERRWRRRVTRHLLHEAVAVEKGGARLTVLAPGPKDLQTMGANLMDPARRLAVLETSLETSAAALRHPDPDDTARKV
jgi:NTE family protein